MAARRGRLLAAGIALSVLLVAACSTTPAAGAPGFTLRLGYFANITHAPAIVAMEQGYLARALGPGVTVETTVFNAGPQAIEALLSGAIDATWIGPNPAVNGYARSKGSALRIISGATSGGARFVVRSGIQTPDDLRGRKIASPQLGNTQDVALRAWLADHGLATDVRGGGDVSILPQANAQSLEAFAAGEIDGAWLPEPWATRLVLEAGATVLVDERDLWPEGRFVTTHLIAATSLIEQRPDVVKGLVTAAVEADAFLRASPDEAKRIVNGAIANVAGRGLSSAILDEAWRQVEFTVDPIGSSLSKSVADAEALGLLPDTDIAGIYDLRFLNQARRERNEPEIAQP
jgi:NitT/TauT family transport system substrate-binding protein